MKKKLMSAVMAVVVTAALSACGNTDSGQKNAAGTAPANNVNDSKSAAPVELRIMWWGDQKRADITNQAIQKFEEKYPNIKVTGEFAPSSGYFDKLNTQLASGTAPDAFFLGGNVVDYANKGVLLDLGPYVGKELNLTDMDKSMVDYGTISGKLVHISVGANARGIMVNTSMFQKAGIPVPTDGWTWNDFAKTSKEISDKLGKGYFGTYDYTTDGMDIAYKQNGKQLYDMAGGKLGFDQQDALNWFGFWNNLHKNGAAVTPDLQVSNPPSDTSKNLVETGKVAMSLIPSNQFAAYQKMTKDKLTLVQVPRGPKGTAVVFESSQGLSGYAKTQHPKEVAELMNFIINDPDSAKILGSDRGVPVTSKNRDLLKQNANSVDQLVYDYTSRVSDEAKKENTKVSYNPPGNNEFIKLSDSTVQEIAFGKKTLEQGVTDFYNGAVKIFNNNKQ